MTRMIAIVIDAEHSHLRVIIWGIFFFVSTYQTRFVVRCSTIYTNSIHALLAIRSSDTISFVSHHSSSWLSRSTIGSLDRQDY